ncbi:triose-phosphate isomerase [Microbacterium mangrovi]|uniref:triose-phosphate isomerase n=1 Tax=Microbacterium mangrovi TaxID=1348253 RepID=UPI0022B1EF0B|nr:triose-phosphate isomerase [Microbacterium mangrovi]
MAFERPFFEIGPKNHLRRPALERLARAAGDAARDHDITVILTVPTAMIAPIADLGTGVHVFAQDMALDPLGDSFGRVTAESLVDAGAVGVMLNHDANPLTPVQLRASIHRARDAGLHTIACAGSEAEALLVTADHPSIVLYEPPELIGTTGSGPREWIGRVTASVREVNPAVRAMHAGGVSTPEIARAIMAAGADGTGSTSGILTANDPLEATHHFIEAAREGWNLAHATPPSDTKNTIREKQK